MLKDASGQNCLFTFKHEVTIFHFLQFGHVFAWIKICLWWLPIWGDVNPHNDVWSISPTKLLVGFESASFRFVHTWSHLANVSVASISELFGKMWCRFISCTKIRIPRYLKYWNINYKFAKKFCNKETMLEILSLRKQVN